MEVEELVAEVGQRGHEHRPVQARREHGGHQLGLDHPAILAAAGAERVEERGRGQAGPHAERPERGAVVADPVVHAPCAGV